MQSIYSTHDTPDRRRNAPRLTVQITLHTTYHVPGMIYNSSTWYTIPDTLYAPVLQLSVCHGEKYVLPPPFAFSVLRCFALSLFQ